MQRLLFYSIKIQLVESHKNLYKFGKTCKSVPFSKKIVRSHRVINHLIPANHKYGHFVSTFYHYPWCTRCYTPKPRQMRFFGGTLFGCVARFKVHQGNSLIRLEGSYTRRVGSLQPDVFKVSC